MTTDRREFLKLLGLTAAGTLVEPKHVFYSFASTPMYGDTLLIHRLNGEVDKIVMDATWQSLQIKRHGHPFKLIFIPQTTGPSTIGWTCGGIGLPKTMEQRRKDPMRIMQVEVMAGEKFIRRVTPPEPNKTYAQIAVKMTAPSYR